MSMEKISLLDAAEKGLALKAYEVSGCGEQAIFVFEGGCFAGLGIDKSELAEFSEVEFDAFDFGDNSLIRLGVYEKEELSLMRDVKLRLFDERREASQRRQYEVLKKRFDPEI